ncbi:hypothetical protein EDB89DRAFT_2065780 [Lactarius sanguifluus]|nr:hypothetical protein EDB89DRAFT_2065780 [Lactarius sanguifluus]
MTLCGQRITFDLEGLDVNPRPIIELLRATSSDRDKWMIVGAFYRRKGNTHAALIRSRHHGKSDLGLKACELRPAFLMLSSCHTELWKRTSAQDGSETEASVTHLDKSRRWLQLVHARYNEGDLLVLRIPRIPHIEDPPNTRTAKRRPEEDKAGFERATRRRLERTLHGLEAQKRVDDAHASVRARADTRSICEQAISEERAKRSTMEECLKRQAQSARPLLDGLAALFFRGQGYS